MRKYLLLSILCILSNAVWAIDFPASTMHSTSSMVSVVGNVNANPGSGYHSQIYEVGATSVNSPLPRNNSDAWDWWEDEEPDPANWADPVFTPIGDVWSLVIMALLWFVLQKIHVFQVFKTPRFFR